MKKLILMLLSLFVTAVAIAQDNVKWETYAKNTGGNEYDIIFKATLKKGYNIYSQFTPEGGPIPSKFDFSANKHIELVGKMTEESTHKKDAVDPIFEIRVIKFSEEVSFIQHIKVKENKPLKITTEYMVCDDKSCQPFFDNEYTIALPANGAPANTPTTTVTAAPPVTTSSAVVTPPITNPIAPSNAIPAMQKPLKHPVKWAFSNTKIAEGEYDLVFTAKIDKNWIIYSPSMKEGGPIPTKFVLSKDANVQAVSKIVEIGKKKEGYDKIFGMNVGKYADKAEFKQRVKIKDIKKPIKGYLEYQTCDDKQCLPPETLNFTFDLGSGQVKADTVATLAPPPVAPPGVGDITSPAAPATAAVQGSDYPSRYIIDKEMSGFSCVEGEVNQEFETKSWWWVFLAGFGGGLLALLTPCVFPMILPVVNYFTKRSKTRAEGIKNAIIYGLSIIAIYVGLGLAVTGIWGADALNFAATHWLPNLLFFLVFVAFALSFFGLFDISLPSSWTNAADKKADSGGYIGIFFMAFTLALASFSCTGPLVGALLVATLSDGAKILGVIPFKPFMGMLGFSSALALPFALFAIFPTWLQSLPRSGKWMDSVKIVLGLLELAIALKFLSAIDMVYTFGILRWEPFLLIWMAIFATIALFLLGILQFGKGKPDKITPARWVLSGLSLAFVAYMGVGLFSYKPLSLLSGLAPPAHYNFFNQKDCPNGLNCFHDFDDALSAAKAEGKPLFVDFTGYACVNCRKMEENVWSANKINDVMSQKYVVASLYVDDRKPLEEDKRYFSTRMNKEIKSVGGKWQDFEITHFQNPAQPYYALIDPVTLKLLNSPVGYTPDETTYLKFLECGLENYKKTKQVGQR